MNRWNIKELNSRNFINRSDFALKNVSLTIVWDFKIKFSFFFFNFHLKKVIQYM